ncbi:MAG: RNA-binding transcriptional accessory protein [Rhodospirillales bacterium]|nr:RNA-binding transcriptional accessory protein [Rhodospirillales bacterium]
MKSITQRIAEELGAEDWQAAAAIALLDEGATVPFIARYRKEATGTLDDAQLRTLEERLSYLRELEDRRKVILESIAEQGKLDDALKAEIEAADTKARLEDLYLPFKPKRRTKAQVARESGLEPLADALIADPGLDPRVAAEGYVNAELNVADVDAALDGARAILVERFAEDAELIGALREEVWTRGRLISRLREGKAEAGAKFADYFDYAEELTKLPSHRILALFRGEKEEVLDLDLAPDEGGEAAGVGADQATYEGRIAHHFGLIDAGRPGDRWLADTVRWAWRTKILVHLQIDLRLRLWQAAEEEAVRVFAGNLRDLLLAAPAGTRTTMGLDPGFRTGVKVAIVDATGKVVATATIYPHEPQRRWDEAIEGLAVLAKTHAVDLIAIGNGTASRETDRLAADLIARHPELGLTRIVVSEAGASVYSASAFASQELPELDVSLRGAVSIARRLQDPLAELVKIDPKSIGVGQYQHDLSQQKLSRSLDTVVEDCVNAVGVDVNTASAPLLARVSGVGDSLAENIVRHRDANGRFATRAALKDVPRLGPKAFELCAGFLRIPGGEDPLDASGVHPEAYPIVRRIITATNKDLKALIGNAPVLRSLVANDFTDANFGVPTVSDILRELEKPGRDPRPAFKTASFRDDVHTLADLVPGMVLEGVVTNVAAFGAFIDIGVHQDGLVHISAMANTFVKDPRAIAKPGDIVRVKVLDVDQARRRIALSMRLEEPQASRPRGTRAEKAPPASTPKPVRANTSQPPRAKKPSPPAPAADGAMAEALRRAGLGGSPTQGPRSGRRR